MKYPKENSVAKSSGSSHNILLCPKESEKGEAVRLIRQGEDSDSDSEGFTEDDSYYNANNNDQVFMIRRGKPRTSTPKSMGKTKSEEQNENLPGKVKADGLRQKSIPEKDPEQEAAKPTSAETNSRANKEKEEEKLKEVRQFLEEIVKNMPKHKQK